MNATAARCDKEGIYSRCPEEKEKMEVNSHRQI
jgi:hypothetical protein